MSKNNMYIRNFEKELNILRKQSKKSDKLIIEDFIVKIEDIMEIFSDQGHSGFSANAYANTIADTIKKALLFEPLSPIYNTDDEWNKVDNRTLQNKRLSSLFKEIKTGECYFLDAIIWQGEEDYDTFSGSVEGVESRQYVKEFPFTPKTFYIDVYKDYDIRKHSKDKMVEGAGMYVYKIKDKKQLDGVFEYYTK